MSILFKIVEKIYLSYKNNLVYCDSLTGARTRMYYDKVMKKKWLQKQVVVGFFDIDNLKELNDTFGHKYGSKVIKISVDRIKDLPGFIEVCRWGADEFVAIFSTNKFSLASARKLHGCSFGYSIKAPYEELQDAVEKADFSMYEHKKLHHNISKGEKYDY